MYTIHTLPFVEVNVNCRMTPKVYALAFDDTRISDAIQRQREYMSKYHYTGTVIDVFTNDQYVELWVNLDNPHARTIVQVWED